MRDDYMTEAEWQARLVADGPVLDHLPVEVYLAEMRAKLFGKRSPRNIDELAALRAQRRA